MESSSGFAGHALKWGKLPAQAKANNLHTEEVPPELSDLNPPEVWLIISLQIQVTEVVTIMHWTIILLLYNGYYLYYYYCG